jgi:hypothetical protein
MSLLQVFHVHCTVVFSGTVVAPGLNALLVTVMAAEVLELPVPGVEGLVGVAEEPPPPPLPPHAAAETNTSAIQTFLVVIGTFPSMS